MHWIVSLKLSSCFSWFLSQQPQCVESRCKDCFSISRTGVQWPLKTKNFSLIRKRYQAQNKNYIYLNNICFQLMSRKVPGIWLLLKPQDNQSDPAVSCMACLLGTDNCGVFGFMPHTLHYLTDWLWSALSLLGLRTFQSLQLPEWNQEEISDHVWLKSTDSPSLCNEQRVLKCLSCTAGEICCYRGYCSDKLNFSPEGLPVFVHL